METCLFLFLVRCRILFYRMAEVLSLLTQQSGIKSERVHAGFLNEIKNRVVDFRQVGRWFFHSRAAFDLAITKREGRYIYC